MLFLMFFTGIFTFAITCSRILFLVVLCGGGICSAALFVMDMIFGALFARGVVFCVMTFVVAHVCSPVI
jgi:hypothetical protein